MVDETISRLEDAINEVVANEYGDECVGELISAAAEALGALRVLGKFDFKNFAYDLSRVAAGAGWVPDDFETRVVAAINRENEKAAMHIKELWESTNED